VVTGKNFDHRRRWVESRLEALAAVFAVDICGFSVMGNHVHVVLRQRPDIAEQWSSEDVARRWWNLYPKRRDEETHAPAEPEPHELAFLMASAEGLAERRSRLSNLSWFMRCLCEPIARRANFEDGCRGRFFEGRFKSQALLTESAVLACSVYVDLNPIRAGIAKTPEASAHTSVQRRIRGEVVRQRTERIASERNAASRSRKPKPAQQPIMADRWLCPVEVDERSVSSARVRSQGAASVEAKPAQQEKQQRPSGKAVFVADVESRRRRASDRGFLPLSLPKYLALVDWTGRQVRQDKRGAIPADLKPILERLSLDPDLWVECVRKFGRWFHRAVGTSASLAARAASSGKQWFGGARRARAAFG